MRARSSAISACCAAMAASADAGLGGTGTAASGESESVGGHMGSLTHAPTRVSSADQQSATWAVTEIFDFCGRFHSLSGGDTVPRLHWGGLSAHDGGARGGGVEDEKTKPRAYDDGGMLGAALPGTP